jgi:hypothetical protein
MKKLTFIIKEEALLIGFKLLEPTLLQEDLDFVEVNKALLFLPKEFHFF